ncbi:MAG TPA: peptidylprolyl isomerase, partial [Vicinamibacteria bacterium]|nr:peptidylprolyl isomerase [Vicinamibacteria bacterium]
MTTAAAPRAIIETKFGEIELELLADKAPGHVKNFTDLAKKGFYDGTTFHRVIPGFMIQGGDPNTKDVNASRAQHGTGGPGYTIKAEFSDTAHKRGVLSMARSTDPNSAGSQFFICVSDSGFLDKNYTAFG